ncbi:MAG: ornithine cyclodeaminase family protein [Thaumarchaeota archaeon]|nr:ornithine cyclodeaminase family protein [Candidatus Calditenuaceae archaeon]MDW8043253.1 ornithine cyclodeaminase family protein [Nitrososphaerota archaeon]
MVRSLSDGDVERALSLREVIEAVERAFALYSTGRALMPQRVHVPVTEHEGTILLMPCYVPEMGVFSVKYVTVYPGNPSRGLPTIFASLLISDPATGEPKVLADARAATGMRTGAATAVSIKHLSRTTEGALGVVGCGYQARWQLKAALEVMRVEKLYLHDIVRSKAVELGEEASRRYGLDVEVADEVRLLASKSDVIITATTSSKPFLKAEWVRPGTHISAIGAFTPQMAELEAELVASSKVVVDSREAAKAEAGDIIQAVQRGLMRWEDVHAELGEVVAGIRPGRESDEEVTVFKSVGLAVQDAAVAALLLRRMGGS